MGSQEMTPREVSAIWDATPEPRSITCNMRTASRLEKKVKDKAKISDRASDGVVFIEKVNA
jgi:hypothetical protein